MWFRKSSQKDTVDTVPVSMTPNGKSFFKFFLRNATVESKQQQQQQPQKESTLLRDEIDIVPKTEITASRQALDNITLALNNVCGESSGESTRKCSDGKQKSCENKYCCGVESHSHDKTADNGNESMKRLRFSENVHIQEIPSIKAPKESQTSHEYVAKVDYGKLEVPDSEFPSLFDWATKYGDYEEPDSLFDVYKTLDVKSRHYRIMSNAEYGLSKPRYSIMNCELFNYEFRHRNGSLGSGCRPDWEHEDFNDDIINTQMDDDTRTIKEFYRLNTINDILVHFTDVKVNTSHTVEWFKDGVFGFLSWFFFRSEEITEDYGKSKLKSWLKRVFGKFTSK